MNCIIENELHRIFYFMIASDMLSHSNLSTEAATNNLGYGVMAKK